MTWQSLLRSAAVRMGGNNLPMILAKEPLTIRDDITLKVDGGGVAFSLDTMHRQQAIMTYQKTAGTLNPGAHPGSYNGQDAYNDMLVVDDGDMGNGNRPGKRRDHEGGCPTLNTTHEHPILMSNRKGHFGMAEDNATTLTAQEKERPLVKYSTVRRLTPLECERLQGFPDGWTDIGEWTDSNGKKHKDADSPRYKALGNSIATPFWFYLLRRIAAQYERPATLGSLFDGIGGFPLCWERCNGPGTAVWASEIEEFCIAVTKRHFPEGTENGMDQVRQEDTGV